MKALEYRKTHEEFNVGYAMHGAFLAGFLAAKHEQEIATFDEKFPDKALSITYEGIAIHYATRPELVAFLTAFGGDWKKEVEDYYPDKMRYFRELEVDGFKYKLEAGQVPPPPSCRIIEEEVEIPAHKEKKKKIVCKDNGDAVEELIAEDGVAQGPQE